MTPLTRETLTPTRKNPYPNDGYGFWSGQGVALEYPKVLLVPIPNQRIGGCDTVHYTNTM
jgi:hypothetical protein